MTINVLIDSGGMRTQAEARNAKDPLEALRLGVKRKSAASRFSSIAAVIAASSGTSHNPRLRRTSRTEPIALSKIGRNSLEWKYAASVLPRSNSAAVAIEVTP
jgi:hypothetical protein